ncbi:MAG: phosphodiester glycosidase family protein [Archangium sp.]|nr:phosphodiester glycosidase family protein [Archangium sp.]
MFALVALVLAAPLQLKELAPGIEYGATRWIEKPSFGDGVLHVVRLDPAKVELRVALASQEKVQKRTAAEWAEGLGLTIAINAGMFDLEDHQSNVGYLRTGEHVNSATWNKYRSALGFGPGRAAMFDLDAPGAMKELEAFPTVIQDLRLIKATGERNVWKPNGRKWSEAAVAIDGQGRLLFFFSRSPLTMKEFNDKLLALPLGITHAMHAEGGPEASLSIRAGELKIDLCGSYETGFNENDDNHRQWPIPNVIGVSARP